MNKQSLLSIIQKRYKVILKPSLSFINSEGEQKTALGLAYPDGHIEILSSIEDDTFCLVLLHEVGHIILKMYAYGRWIEDDCDAFAVQVAKKLKLTWRHARFENSPMHRAEIGRAAKKFAREIKNDYQIGVK